MDWWPFNSSASRTPTQTAAKPIVSAPAVTIAPVTAKPASVDSTSLTSSAGRLAATASAAPSADALKQALARLTSSQRKQFDKLSKALKDPKNGSSPADVDLALLLGSGGSDSRLLRHDTTGHTLLETLSNYAGKAPTKPGDFSNLPDDPAFGKDITRSVLTDMIHDLAHLPGTEIDTRTVYQGDNTNNCVPASMQADLLRTDPAEAARIALGVVLDGSVTLRNGATLKRATGFDVDSNGKAMLKNRPVLDAVLQNSLKAFGMASTGDGVPPGQTLESAGLSYRQMKLLHDAVMGGDATVLQVDASNRDAVMAEIKRYVVANHEYPLRLDDPTRLSASTPIQILLPTDTGTHLVTITGYERDSKTGLAYYLVTDPQENFRYGMTPEEIAQGIFGVILPTHSTLSGQPSDALIPYSHRQLWPHR